MSRFAFSLILLTFLVVTLGALTRLLDAGLGCPDWPVCYGKIIPAESLQQTPHSDFNLWEYDSGKAWMEMIHRYAASLLGLLIIFQLIWAFKTNSKPLKIMSSMILAWVILQGLFGMWTVTLRLWPPVVSAHLLGGAITLGLQFAIWRATKEAVINPLKRPDWMALALVVFIQMGLGAWTSSQYAGLACPDFPTCQGRWWIELDSSLWSSPMVAGDEYLGGVQTMKQRMAVQWLHRLGALAVLLTFLFVVFRQPNRIKSWSLIAGLLGIQITLGILNAVWLLPLSLALLHNSFAMLLWLAVIHGMLTQEKQDAKTLAYAQFTA